MKYADTTIGGAPSMPSGDGQPLKPLVCCCADCDFTGSLSASLEHYRDLQHRLTHHGKLQDFAHLLARGPILPGGIYLPKKEQ